MKKSFALLAGCFLLVMSCNKSNSDKQLNDESEETTATERKCAADDVLQDELKADPSLRQRMDAIEEFTRRFKDNPQMERLLPGGVIEIPVVFNVLYRTAAQNVSLAQLQSQIDVLNEDFAATNATII